MQKGHVLHFDCQKCQENIDFSIFDLEQQEGCIYCAECGQSYSFKDENLKRQIIKFEKLCLQIVESEEILGDASVGIDVDGRQVKVPYKILLTRLSSTLDLHIGNKPLSIDFRIDPMQEEPVFSVIKKSRPLKQKAVKIPLKFKVGD